ncbi:MAG: hypothetical protein IPP46_19685 [Bacteroidetes bacterium]|nr:hypothetical protein [Bacteroidota bacterium]
MPATIAMNNFSYRSMSLNPRMGNPAGQLSNNLWDKSELIHLYFFLHF